MHKPKISWITEITQHIESAWDMVTYQSPKITQLPVRCVCCFWPQAWWVTNNSWSFGSNKPQNNNPTKPPQKMTLWSPKLRTLVPQSSKLLPSRCKRLEDFKGWGTNRFLRIVKWQLCHGSEERSGMSDNRFIVMR